MTKLAKALQAAAGNAGAQGVQIIGWTSFSSDGGSDTNPVSMTLPAGTQAGDLVLIVVGFSDYNFTGDFTVSTSGWTVYSQSWSPDLYNYKSGGTWKVIDSGDLSGLTITFPSSTTKQYTEFVIVTIRGATSVSFTRQNQLSQGLGGTQTLGSTLKTANTKYVLGWVIDRSGANDYSTSASSPDFTLEAQVKAFTSAIFCLAVFIIDASLYSNGGSLYVNRTINDNSYAAQCYSALIEG